MTYVPRVLSLLLLGLWPAYAHANPGWGDVGRDIYFETQWALAERQNADALKAAAAMPVPDEAARMWRSIYRGVALDRLGRRTEAVIAYQEAERFHPHGIALAGKRAPQRSLEHITSLEELLEEHGPFTIRRIRFDRESATLLVPSGPAPEGGHPLVVRVGHPRKRDRVIAQILEVRRHLPAGAPVVIAASTILDPKPSTAVDAPHLLKTVPARFERWLDGVERAAPIDVDRVYLTGFSFDGVWAWILGYENPDRYAAVVPLSAVSYPAAIQRGVAARIRLPVCVLRGAQDHMFPRRWAEEQATGRTLVSINPMSRFTILPDVDHSGVWGHSDACYRWMLEHRRVQR